MCSGSALSLLPVECVQSTSEASPKHPDKMNYLNCLLSTWMSSSSLHWAPESLSSSACPYDWAKTPRKGYSLQLLEQSNSVATPCSWLEVLHLYITLPVRRKSDTAQGLQVERYWETLCRSVQVLKIELSFSIWRPSCRTLLTPKPLQPWGVVLLGLDLQPWGILRLGLDLLALIKMGVRWSSCLYLILWERCCCLCWRFLDFLHFYFQPHSSESEGFVSRIAIGK